MLQDHIRETIQELQALGRREANVHDRLLEHYRETFLYDPVEMSARGDTTSCSSFGTL